MKPRTIIGALAATAGLAGTLPATAADAQNFPHVVHLPASVVRADEAKPLAAGDAHQIDELLNRVYLAEDTRDAVALRQLVTPDFIQNHGVFGRLQGREQFAQWVVGHPEFFDGIRHQAINTVTASTGKDTAEAVSYILVIQVFSAQDDAAVTTPRLIGHGVVKDILKKQHGRWYISSRTYDQFSILPAFVPDETLRIKARSERPLEAQ